MEKRLFIAVMISIAFLFAWGAILPRVFPELARKPAKPAPVESSTPPAESPRTDTATATPPSPTDTAATRPPAAPRKTDQEQTPAAAPSVQETRVVVTQIATPEFVARFSNRGAQLTSFTLLKYQQRKSSEPVELVRPREAGRTDFPFAIESADSDLADRANQALYIVEDRTSNGRGSLVYRYTDPAGWSVTKTFSFGEPYRFGFAVEVSPRAPVYRIAIGPGLRALQPGEQDDRFSRAGYGIVQNAGSFDLIAREKAEPFQAFEGTPDFIGLEDNYFLAVLQPRRSGNGSFRSIQIPAPEKKTRKEIYAGLNAVNGRVDGAAFFGPKETKLLDQYGLSRALQFGVFGPIARLLLWALQQLYDVTKNYGWAIIVLTIIIKVLLYPLQHKSIVSMKKMQRLQPRMSAIKDKYKKAKSDPEQRQKMNAEMMKLYQQEGINPASGCLPILLQLPILWAFYTLLSNAIELRGADFALWINDLSAKDPYYITPILMTVTMFIQQYMTPSTADPMQRRIFLAMPFIFGWIFKEFPSGLVLYWLVQNILSIIQQAIMNKYWKEHPDPPAEGGPPKLRSKKATP